MMATKMDTGAAVRRKVTLTTMTITDMFLIVVSLLSCLPLPACTIRFLPALARTRTVTMMMLQMMIQLNGMME